MLSKTGITREPIARSSGVYLGTMYTSFRRLFSFLFRSWCVLWPATVVGRYLCKRLTLSCSAFSSLAFSLFSFSSLVRGLSCTLRKLSCFSSALWTGRRLSGVFFSSTGSGSLIDPDLEGGADERGDDGDDPLVSPKLGCRWHRIIPQNK